MDLKDILNFLLEKKKFRHVAIIGAADEEDDDSLQSISIAATGGLEIVSLLEFAKTVILKDKTQGASYEDISDSPSSEPPDTFGDLHSDDDEGSSWPFTKD